MGNPVTGCKLGSNRSVSTISDVPSTSLRNGKECVMVVLVDRNRGCVLLQVPNKLGWRLHFGFELDTPDSSARELVWKNAISAAAGQLKGAGFHSFAENDLRPA